mmetsp:Transcript_869/g.2028  ORF Transcript_869/g.2028 Transcript_869/m.2028 type:complete len:282 (-) Transcript_869:3181-4026(-)
MARSRPAYSSFLTWTSPPSSLPHLVSSVMVPVMLPPPPPPPPLLPPWIAMKMAMVRTRQRLQSMPTRLVPRRARTIKKCRTSHPRNLPKETTMAKRRLSSRVHSPTRLFPPCSDASSPPYRPAFTEVMRTQRPVPTVCPRARPPRVPSIRLPAPRPSPPLPPATIPGRCHPMANLKSPRLPSLQPTDLPTTPGQWPRPEPRRWTLRTTKSTMPGFPSRPLVTGTILVASSSFRGLSCSIWPSGTTPVELPPRRLPRLPSPTGIPNGGRLPPPAPAPIHSWG